MGEFKKGDRVRRIDESFWPEEFGVEGQEYSVLEVNDHGGIKVIEGDASFASHTSFELVRPAFKLEAGKYYRTRDGRKVGPLELSDNGELAGALGFRKEHWYTQDNKFYPIAGRTISRFETDSDLIAEWVDEPKKGKPAPMVLRDGKIFFDISASGPSRVIRQLIKTKQGYGFEIARQGDYVWVDTGSTAPMTLKAADVVLTEMQVAA